MVQSAKAKGGKEIPIPTVEFVPTYKRDYLPTFTEQSTYIRGRGALDVGAPWLSAQAGGPVALVLPGLSPFAPSALPEPEPECMRGPAGAPNSAACILPPNGPGCPHMSSRRQPECGPSRWRRQRTRVPQHARAPPAIGFAARARRRRLPGRALCGVRPGQRGRALAGRAERRPGPPAAPAPGEPDLAPGARQRGGHRPRAGWRG